MLQTDQQLKEAALQADDSDLEKKRREAEALLQSVGITTDVSAGIFISTFIANVFIFLSAF